MYCCDGIKTFNRLTISLPFFSRCLSNTGLLSRFSKEPLNISHRHGWPTWFTPTRIMNKNPTKIKTILQKYMTQSPSVTPTLLSTDRKMYDFLRCTWNLLNSSWSEYCCALPRPLQGYLFNAYLFIFVFVSQIDMRSSAILIPSMKGHLTLTGLLAPLKKTKESVFYSCNF